MITALTWVPKGAARVKPVRFELSQEEYARIKLLAKAEEDIEKDNKDTEVVDEDEVEQTEALITGDEMNEEEEEDTTVLPPELRMDEYDDDSEHEDNDDDENFAVSSSSDINCQCCTKLYNHETVCYHHSQSKKKLERIDIEEGRRK